MLALDPTRQEKQKQAEAKLREHMDSKNREELTDNSKAKNLKWRAVGRRGEKRVVRPERIRQSSSHRGDEGGGLRERWTNRQRRGDQLDQVKTVNKRGREENVTW